MNPELSRPPYTLRPSGSTPERHYQAVVRLADEVIAAGEALTLGVRWRAGSSWATRRSSRAVLEAERRRRAPARQVAA